MKEGQPVTHDFRMVLRVAGVVLKESILHPFVRSSIRVNPRERTITVTREKKPKAK